MLSAEMKEHKEGNVRGGFYESDRRKRQKNTIEDIRRDGYKAND